MNSLQFSLISVVTCDVLTSLTFDFFQRRNSRTRNKLNKVINPSFLIKI